MSQDKNRAKRVRARKHRDRLRTVSARVTTIHYPVARWRLVCATCRENVYRKETEPLPRRCPYCQDENATFVRKEKV